MDSQRRQLAPLVRPAADEDVCLVRSTASQRRQLDRLLYRRYPDQEWGSFFRFGFRPTRWGLLVTFVDLLPPEPGDLDERSPLVEFRPGYIGRALSSFDSASFGVGVIHSHPEDCAPSPSPADNDMDGYFAAEFEKFSNGRPYLSLIVSRDRNGVRHISGRCFHRGKWLAVSDWLTCGTDVLRREASYLGPRKAVASSVSTERVSQLLGNVASSRLRGAVVGILGCSGLGTPAAHVLARAGVGEFVLIDPGIFKDSNHERNHASRASDLGTTGISKVELLQRLIHEINPDAKVTPLTADVLDDRAVDELVRCDLIIGCSDSDYARAALGDIATHYSVPVLDLAVQMAATDGVLSDQVGEIARYLPGLPCPWCRNRVSAAAIRAETATEEERARAKWAAEEARKRGDDGAQYWIGDRPQELTVGYMTTVVAAMGAGYAQNWLTGAAAMPHDRFQFDLGSQQFGFVEDSREAQHDCSCQRCTGFADQGRADFTVSMPQCFRVSP